MGPRQALYFAPSPTSRLHAFASAWLGRDARSGLPVPRAVVEGLAAADLARITESPRRYGFHATLKAPFRLAPGMTVDLLHQAVRAFAASRPAFTIGIEVTSLRGFLAFTARPPVDELNDFAAACVRGFEPFRAPLADDELQRRRPELLSARQREYLALWGYPYVMDEFVFHMTLTERLAGAEHDRLLAMLQRSTADLVAPPLPIDRLSVFEEPEPGASFRMTGSYPLAT